MCQVSPTVSEHTASEDMLLITYKMNSTVPVCPLNIKH